MYACICGVILLYELGLLVCLDVILVTIVILTAFLRPSGINVLVGLPVHLALLLLLGVAILGIPQAFAVAGLDLPVLLPGVPLLRSFNKGRVNYLALIERKALAVEKGAELVRQAVEGSGLRKPVPTCPDGLLIKGPPPRYGCRETGGSWCGL